MKIIGLTGTNASGKDTVAEFLIRRGYDYYSLSDILRQELALENTPVTRDSTIRKGNEIREKFGAGELSERVLKKIRKDQAEKAVVVSIRNPEEVKVLQKNSDFTLWFVDAPIETRYERTQIRKRPEDRVSFEQFRVQEQTENSADPLKQQLATVAKMANEKIANDQDLTELYRITETLLKKYEEKR